MLKILRASAIAVAVVAVVGCAAVIGTETHFTPWSGQTVTQGSGGAVEMLDGIEIWTHGAPERRYKVIGVVEQTRSDDAFDNMVFGKFNRSELVALVKKAGGHGLVTIRSERVGTADSTQRSTVMAVFRYEP